MGFVLMIEIVRNFICFKVVVVSIIVNRGIIFKVFVFRNYGYFFGNNFYYLGGC